MPRFMLSHRHEPHECPVVFAAWRGFDSPLRHHPTVGSCAHGDHRLWWTVDAAGPADALAQLPEYLAVRTDVTAVAEVAIP